MLVNIIADAIYLLCGIGVLLVLRGIYQTAMFRHSREFEDARQEYKEAVTRRKASLSKQPHDIAQAPLNDDFQHPPAPAVQARVLMEYNNQKRSLADQHSLIPGLQAPVHARMRHGTKSFLRRNSPTFNTEDVNRATDYRLVQQGGILADFVAARRNDPGVTMLWVDEHGAVTRDDLRIVKVTSPNAFTHLGDLNDLLEINEVKNDLFLWKLERRKSIQQPNPSDFSRSLQARATNLQ